MKKFFDYIVDTRGDAVNGASVAVKMAGTSNDATLYSDNGVTTTANPVTTDTKGYFSFYIADGWYDIVVSGTGVTTQTITDVEIHDELSSSYLTETKTATAGQKAFTLTTMSYVPGINNLSAYINGVRQAPSAYTETDANTVTFTSGLDAGDTVQFVSSDSVSVSSGTADTTTYDQGGAGSVATNVGAKLRETISVKDFGAVGNGVADDTAAIQAAIDAAEANVSLYNGGSTVYIPTGSYLVTATLTVRTGQITICGEGLGSQITRNSDFGETFNIADASPSSTKIALITIRDLYILSKFADTTLSASQIVCEKASGMTISNVRIQDGFGVLDLQGCDNVFIDNCFFASGQRYSGLQSGSFIVKIGAYSDGTQSSSIYINNTQIHQDTGTAYIEYGLWVQGADGLYVTGSHIGFTETNIMFQPGSATTAIQNVMFSSCYIDGNVEASVFNVEFAEAVSTPHTSVYENISFVGCSFLRPSENAVRFTGATTNEIMFSGCRFLGGDTDGVHCVSGSAPTYVTFSGCIFDKWNRDAAGSAWDIRFASGNSADYWAFTGCHFISADTTQNFAFNGSEDNILINSCTFSSTDVGGTPSGKTISITNSTGMTTDLTENSGTGSITSGSTTDVITHGLMHTPSIDDITITFAENPTNDPGNIWVDTITSTQFTVNCRNDPGASNLDFGWRVRINP